MKILNLSMIIIGALFSFLFNSCVDRNYISVSSSAITEKEELLINNNNRYSDVSIVGGGANLIDKEKELFRQKANQKVIDQLEGIEGIHISSFKDKEGKEQIKATLQGDILFAFDNAELDTSAITVMEQFIHALNDVRNKRLVIIGHTDNVGKEAYNKKLSLNRANSVSSVLKDAGFSEAMIQVKGKGYSEPVASNETAEGRSKNRRVEIYIID